MIFDLIKSWKQGERGQIAFTLLRGLYLIPPPPPKENKNKFSNKNNPPEVGEKTMVLTNIRGIGFKLNIMVKVMVNEFENN